MITARFLLAGVLALLVLSPLRADLVFEHPSVDLGTIRVGQVVERSYSLVNRGGTAVEVLEAKASCGCMRPEVTPRLIPSGRRAELKLNVNTLSAGGGAHIWQIAVRYRSPSGEETAGLAVKADVIREIIVTPPALNVFTQGSTQHQVTVRDLRPSPLRIRHAEATSPFVRVDAPRQAADEQGRPVQTVDFRLVPELPAGQHEIVVLLHTDDAVYPEIRVPVQVEKKSRQRLAATPASLELIASPAQPKPARLVTVRDRQGAPVQIERVETSHAAIRVEHTEGPASVAMVKIAVEPAAAAAAGTVFRGEVRVHFRQPAGELILIPVSLERREMAR